MAYTVTSTDLQRAGVHLDGLNPGQVRRLLAAANGTIRERVRCCVYDPASATHRETMIDAVAAQVEALLANPLTAPTRAGTHTQADSGGRLVASKHLGDATITYADTASITSVGEHLAGGGIAAQAEMILNAAGYRPTVITR